MGGFKEAMVTYFGANLNYFVTSSNLATTAIQIPVAYTTTTRTGLLKS